MDITFPSAFVSTASAGHGRHKTNKDQPASTGAADPSSLDSDLLEEICATILEDLASIDRTDAAGFESFLDRYLLFQPVLHPNHHCVVEASRILSQLCGNGASAESGHSALDEAVEDAGDEEMAMRAMSTTMTPAQLKLKEECCRRVLKVVDIVQPGEEFLP